MLQTMTTILLLSVWLAMTSAEKKVPTYNISEVTRYQSSPITPFIALYHGSQGSTWFVEALSELNGVCLLGNELIDRVTQGNNRLTFIETATQPPQKNKIAFEAWKQQIVLLASENPSPYDGRYLSNCWGNETVFGYKARLNFQEMRYIFSDDVQSRLGIKIFILSRNPIKQSLSAYRRDFEHHDQRVVNFLASVVDAKCARNKNSPFCIDKIREYENAKAHISTIDFAKYRRELRLHLQYYNERTKELAEVITSHNSRNILQNILELTYEEMEDDMEATLKEKILPFLNIDKHSVSAQVNALKQTKDFFRIKSTPHLLCQAISNFNSFCEFMRQNTTELQGMLSESLLEYANVDACDGDNFGEKGRGDGELNERVKEGEERRSLRNFQQAPARLSRTLQQSDAEDVEMVNRGEKEEEKRREEEVNFAPTAHHTLFKFLPVIPPPDLLAEPHSNQAPSSLSDGGVLHCCPRC